MPRPILDNWIISKIKSDFRFLDRSELERYQLDQINRTLTQSISKSGFYRQRFGNKSTDDSGAADPIDNLKTSVPRLKSWSDFEKLPFTTPDDLRADPYKLLCVHPNEISRIVTLQTSGSTGASKRVFFTDADLELCRDFFHYGMQNLVNKTDIVGILFPHATPASVGDQLIHGLGRFGAKAVPLFGLIKEQVASAIQSEQITSLVGMPGQIADLAKEYPNLSSIKTVLLSADYVSDEVRRTIKDAWNAEVFEHYGMTEMGLGCAVSCEYQKGYHVREADLYLEIIDPETGTVLPDGAWGEIVFTTLTRAGMPFIRYRTGDISRWKTEPCLCGSNLKLLDYIQDRQVKKGRINY